VSTNYREAILEAGKRAAQTYGYSGLNFRDLGEQVGIKSASIYYHFKSKADLGAAVARRYWEDTRAELDAISAATPDPLLCLRQYPELFRRSLANENRLCLGSFLGAEFDDVPDEVKAEVQAFADINVAWLSKVLRAASTGSPEQIEQRARAIYAAVSGAQLFARSRSDIALFDELIEGYRVSGPLLG
jgi:TetR/AcrR family transcriptional repressor of nem operon